MGVWTETEFQQISAGVRLSRRTLAACKAVLVDDMLGVDAAALNKMFPSQVSRGIGILREHQAELVQSAEEMKPDDALFKYAAAAVAKYIAGDGLVIVDAQPGTEYVGPVIVNSHGFAVQQVGRTGVMHNHDALGNVPALNVSLTIAYLNTESERMMATVMEHPLANEMSEAKSLER